MGNNGQPEQSTSHDVREQAFSAKGMRIFLTWLVIVVVLGGSHLGCRRFAPIHVWQPPQAPMLSKGRVAIVPISGNPELATALQHALLIQRPPTRADVAVFSPEQLLEYSAVRLASTAPLASDILALAAARQAGEDVILQGEILAADIDLLAVDKEDETAEPVNWNQSFFQKKDDGKTKHERIILAWRVIDVSSGKTVGTSTFNLATQKALDQYPDLKFFEQDQTHLLIAATARESWKAVAPYVAKDEVRLSVPWLQPGAFTVRRGVRAARKGNWELAERHWQRVADTFWFNAAAHHNLALAYAAREDFPAAKSELQKATGPLAIRLPHETLYWLDQQHRQHNSALGLGTPTEGWAFSEPNPALFSDANSRHIEVADISTLPWWTALPTKPPGWTWQGWLSQPGD